MPGALPHKFANFFHFEVGIPCEAGVHNIGDQGRSFSNDPPVTPWHIKAAALAFCEQCLTKRVGIFVEKISGFPLSFPTLPLILGSGQGDYLLLYIVQHCLKSSFLVLGWGGGGGGASFNWRFSAL